MSLIKNFEANKYFSLIIKLYITYSLLSKEIFD